MSIRKANMPIETLEVWESKAGPKNRDHWQDHRSAKECARAWLEVTAPRLPLGLADLLASHPNFGTVIEWTAEPEAKIRFDNLAGEPRNTDLLVCAKDSFG